MSTNNISMVKKLIADNRGYAPKQGKNYKGRIIVILSEAKDIIEILAEATPLAQNDRGCPTLGV